jgi:hypothetical protein
MHLEPTLGHLELGQLSPSHVQALIKTKTVEGLSPRTIRYMRAALRTTLNDAAKWGVVTRNSYRRKGSPPRRHGDTGHSQISLTLDTYSHVLPALGAEAASKMDLLVGVKREVRRA